MSNWAPALVGLELGGYQIGPYLSKGGFGMVFEATNLATSAPCAIKVLDPNHNAQDAAEFDGEGDLLAKLARRSHVINLLDSGSENVEVDLRGIKVPLALKYHVMALASGSVDELIANPVTFAALPWVDRLHHWRGAIMGVHQMHLSKVAHRDLKLSNCLLMLGKGGKTEVRIADLGRSKDFSLPPSLPPGDYYFGRGDNQFAPPEYLWCQGGFTEQDFRCADLYGVGSLLVELATGHGMTAIAIGSWQAAQMQGVQDHRINFRRDLSALRPKYHRAIEHVALQIPTQIRREAVQLIRQLCDPVPSERLPKIMGKPPKDPDDGLHWLLRRADILIGNLTVDRRRWKYSRKARNMNAS
ncbi:protein kinase domain-containing protein [Mycolicibacterium aichiense]|uniref:protein kinase domain-containing protein n=1 Tax=Mycolicibacterium aichiense TaxID=1799 RepID=UPI0013D651BD|nr:serine/threonine-protein kinase [Mycolicibacterium aichiense]MCV7017782.1 serine/threonine protein kinase [Mycolicibacterium aichiense]